MFRGPRMTPSCHCGSVSGWEEGAVLRTITAANSPSLGCVVHDSDPRDAPRTANDETHCARCHNKNKKDGQTGEHQGLRPSKGLAHPGRAPLCRRRHLV